jgi:alpha-ketoglutarate-dependent taurine dioxygenase
MLVDYLHGAYRGEVDLMGGPCRWEGGQATVIDGALTRQIAVSSPVSSLERREAVDKWNEVTTIVSQRVLQGAGYAVLDLGLADGAPIETVVRVALEVGNSIGHVLRQNGEGATVIHVRDRGVTMEGGGRYHETNTPGSLHTDGPQLDTPPDVLLMLSIRQADVGGESVLVDGAVLHQYLAMRKPEIFRILHFPFYFDRRGFDYHSPDLYRPVYECSQDSVGMRYLCSYILSGHTKRECPLTEMQRAALLTLEELLNDSAFQVRVSLPPGQMLIVDNQRMCHGRTAFHDRGVPRSLRHLIRLWVSLSSR